ncbi:MAG: hypothetical protein WC028_29390, partial [Candidatus Obscuribacterales bacterium]
MSRPSETVNDQTGQTFNSQITIKGKFTMSTLSIVILLAVAGVIAGAIFSPKFRQLLRIRGGKAVDA